MILKMLVISKSLVMSTSIIVPSNEEYVIGYSIVGILAIIGCIFINIGEKESSSKDKVENLSKEEKKEPNELEMRTTRHLVKEEEWVKGESPNKEQQKISNDIHESMEAERLPIISVSEEDIVIVISRFELKKKKNNSE